jgi:DNA-binding IclR family transcriptional regulator
VIAVSGDNVVDVAARREAVSDLLRDGPMAKRDVIAATDHSRSTVDRAVAELRAAGLVTERAGGYETTPPGVLALAVRREYDATAAAQTTTGRGRRRFCREVRA